MKLRTLLALTALTLFLLPHSKASSTEYTLEKITDADTIVVKSDSGETSSIRLACIDAAETPHSAEERESTDQQDLNQFKWGLKAKARLAKIIKKGDRLNLNITDTDLYGRLVAEVRFKNIFIQQTLVQEGLAVSYPRYFASCPSHSLISNSELKAKQQKLNIWSDRSFVNPADYRHR